MKLLETIRPLLPVTVPLRINEIDIGAVTVKEEDNKVVIIPDDKTKTIIERMMMK